MALTKLKTGAIADDAVTGAKIADDTVAEANIANDAIGLTELKAGTDGQIITYDASGNPTAVGPGTDGQVLTSTGAGSPPAFETISIPAGTTINNNADNRVITGSGTANTLEGEANLTFDGTSLLTVHVPSATGEPAINFTNSDTGTGTGNGFGLGINSSESPYIWNRENTDLRIATNNSERLRIDSSGNVGIGTNAPLKTLTTKAGSNTHAFYIAADNDATDGWGFHADSSSGALKIDRSLDNNFGYRRATFHEDGGLCFGSDTAAANALDDYEEGNFTPVWLWSPNDVSDESYSTQSGQYVKIGKTVFFRIELTLTSKGTVSGAGYSQISGLPFQCGGPSSVSIGFFSGFGSFMPAIASVSTAEQIYIAQLNSGGYSQDLQHTHMSDSSRIYVGGTYLSN